MLKNRQHYKTLCALASRRHVYEWLINRMIGIVTLVAIMLMVFLPFGSLIAALLGDDWAATHPLGTVALFIPFAWLMVWLVIRCGATSFFQNREAAERYWKERSKRYQYMMQIAPLFVASSKPPEPAALSGEQAAQAYDQALLLAAMNLRADAAREKSAQGQELADKHEGL